MRIIYSPRFMEHRQSGMNPEKPQRLAAVIEGLRGSGLRYDQVEPGSIDHSELLIVHSRDHIETIRRYSILNADEPENRFGKDTAEIASLAASAAYEAAAHSFSGGGFSFAMVRPPGHHAGIESYGGFCYFNNIAFAIRKLQSEHSGMHAMIVDIDVHHGNGTQEIFHDDRTVFFLSLHQDPYSTYPGTGFRSENNDHILNVELPRSTDDNEYLDALSKALEVASAFKPDIVGISAGFDTYAEDPIGDLKISKSDTYMKIGRMIDGAFGCMKFAVLEGGYFLPSLGENVCSFLKAFER